MTDINSYSTKSKIIVKFFELNDHNSGETKNQVVTTNPFILNFLQRFECSCTHFQAINFSVNPQKSARFSM